MKTKAEIMTRLAQWQNARSTLLPFYDAFMKAADSGNAEEIRQAIKATIPELLPLFPEQPIVVTTAFNTAEVAISILLWTLDTDATQ